MMAHLRNVKTILLKEDKIRGYGETTRKSVDPFLPRFRVISYRVGPYSVLDRYTGLEQFAGQTTVFYRGRTVYALNYYGRILSRRLKIGPVYGFLKRAIVAGAGREVYRGLDGYKEEGLTYKNRHRELRGLVVGEEKILLKGKLVYSLFFHGGPVEDSRSLKRWLRGVSGKHRVRLA